MKDHLLIYILILPQDFYMIEKSTCFSEFVCRLGLTKILPEVSYKSYDNFMRWLIFNIKIRCVSYSPLQPMQECAILN